MKQQHDLSIICGPPPLLVWRFRTGWRFVFLVFFRFLFRRTTWLFLILFSSLFVPMTLFRERCFLVGFVVVRVMFRVTAQRWTAAKEQQQKNRTIVIVCLLDEKLLCEKSRLPRSGSLWFAMFFLGFLQFLLAVFSLCFQILFLLQQLFFSHFR